MCAEIGPSPRAVCLLALGILGFCLLLYCEQFDTLVLENTELPYFGSSPVLRRTVRQDVGAAHPGGPRGVGKLLFLPVPENRES